MNHKISAISFRDLDYLVALSDERHFGRAAARCFVSQPTLSTQIRKVEDVLGVKIFERSRKEILLTPQGEYVVSQAMLTLQQAGKLTLSYGKTTPLTGRLCLGSLPTLSPYLFDSLLVEVLPHYPELDLNIVEYHTTDLLNALDTGSIDLMVAAATPELAHTPSLPLFDEPLVLVVGKDHPPQDAVTSTHLRKLPMITLDRRHCLTTQTEALCQSNLKVNLGTRPSSLETLRQLVAAKRGVAVFPKLATLRPSPLDALLRYLPITEATREIRLYHRSGSPFLRDATPLAKHIQSVAQGLLGS